MKKIGKANNGIYIGVTDIQTPEQSQVLLDAFIETKLNGSHRLMPGVVISPSIMKNSDEVSLRLKAFIKHNRIHNVIHFRSWEHQTFFRDLQTLLQQIPNEIYDGIQINIPWPSSKQVRDMRKKYLKEGRQFLVLEIGASAFKTVNSSNDLIKKLREYHDCVDYILLDYSRGKIEGNTENIKKYICDIRGSNLDFGLMLAGDLSSDSIHQVGDLLRRFSLGVNAETKLRAHSGELHLLNTARYIQKTAEYYVH